MKVITMESSAFTAPDGTDSRKAAHVRAVSGERKEEAADRLLTTREAAHLLNVSTRTLQRMRSEQRIAYVVLRGKCRYRQSEIDRLLADCTVMEDAVTPKDLKHNHTLRTGGKPQRKEDITYGTAYPKQFRELDAELMERLDRQDELLLSLQPSGKARIRWKV